jgi:pyruvate dehydrogenase E1 component
MFGFQRVGDLIWAAADQRARGFLIGATAGRTTLGGEGLQHQDGSSHVLAATIPNCRAYDPAFAYELAAILDHGMRSMFEGHEDFFYYITVMNESYAQPSAPAGIESRIVQGTYRLPMAAPVGTTSKAAIRLIGSGAILREVLAAADLLRTDWAIESEAWSVTSFSELAREAREVQRWNRLHPLQPSRISYLAECLSGESPIVAATDYIRAYPQLIAEYLESDYVTLGTDGFGRSDTREQLRGFFEVNRFHVAITALEALARRGTIPRETVAAAIARYDVAVETPPSWNH